MKEQIITALKANKRMTFSQIFGSLALSDRQSIWLAGQMKLLIAEGLVCELDCPKSPWTFYLSEAAT